MADMLKVATTSLARTELAYIAFRLACLDTRERLELAIQLDLCPERNFGFLTEVPFLKNVPAQVQLDLLMETWARHITPITQPANLLDESVVYAACETAARLIRSEPEVARRFLNRGPIQCSYVLDAKLADSLQQLHIHFAQEGLFLLLSQFQDIPPLEAVPLKRENGFSDGATDCLFDVLGRWYVSSRMLTRAQGLLTRVEIEQMGSLLNTARCLKNTQ
ncbi:hypothetical protein SH661x_000810 [Planctomicrobium sp. SH661]|uniref:hypothetical protein n=1 Tax=Planctomicrobium sp. SH661 TaxID=3448124 RepID=UPI003F5B12E7